jgi:hypothetical protein
MATAKQQANVRVATPLLHLPNASSTGSSAEQSNRILRGQDGTETRKPRCSAAKGGARLAYCHYSIAEQVAAALGALDEHIKAVICLRTTLRWGHVLQRGARRSAVASAV